MVTDYDVLVDVYDLASLGLVGERLMPSLITFAQRQGWMGRRTLDLGCGLGHSMDYLAQHGYIITGMDCHAGILDGARARYQTRNLTASWEQQDIRDLNYSGNPFDLVTAINVLSELESIREIEQVARGVHGILKDRQWFIFDLLTIEGLHARSTPQHEILHDADDLFVVADNVYDFERTIQRRRYVIFRREGQEWSQQLGQRVLRAYPTQAIVTLVKRAGFAVLHVLTTDLTTYDPQSSRTHRVIIITQKA